MAQVFYGPVDWTPERPAPPGMPRFSSHQPEVPDMHSLAYMKYIRCICSLMKGFVLILVILRNCWACTLRGRGEPTAECRKRQHAARAADTCS
jgi:hypothetical protein